MIFQEPPNDFSSRFEIASCFVQHDSELLLLLRQDDRPEGNTWGIPTGKIKKNEQPIETMLRELKEETGIHALTDDLIFLEESYVKFPTYDFKAHVYRLLLTEKPEIVINPQEHKDFLWSPAGKTIGLPLIHDLNNWIKYFLKL